MCSEISGSNEIFEGQSRKSGELFWKASKVDLKFSLNIVPRTIAEVYTCDNAKEKFIKDFIKAWVKVMNAGWYDLNMQFS